MDKRIQEGCGESARDDAVSGEKPATCVIVSPAVSVKDVFNGRCDLTGDLMGVLKRISCQLRY